MTKAKGRKSGSGIPQKHLHSRISYLHQSAAYLASAEEMSRSLIPADSERQVHAAPFRKSTFTQSRHLLSQMRAVSLKAQIRLSPELKHSFCRRCNSLLAPGKTSNFRLTNNSRHGDKPWADVLVVTCGFCGAVRRFPIGRNCGRDKVVASDEAQRVVDVSEHDHGKGPR